MMWADYVKEKSGVECIVNEHGFLTYKIVKNECYLEDIFVVQEKRKSGIGSMMLGLATEAAKSAGCTFLSSCIRPSEATSSVSMAAHLSVGFKIHSSFDNKIFMIKELL